VIDRRDPSRPAPPTTTELAANLLATNRLATNRLPADRLATDGLSTTHSVAPMIGGRPDGRIQLLLVDRQVVVREGIRALAELQPDFSVVGTCASASMGRAACQADPEVIVTDVDLPGAQDAEVVDQLRRTFPSSAVLVLTHVEHPARVRQVLDAGVSGYLLKSVPPSELFFGMRSVARGDSTRQRPFMGAVSRPKGATSSSRANVGQLTAKETEVLRLLVQGYTNREIADQRNVSLRTVESQRARIIDKTGMRTRAELVQHARSLGLQRRAS
jgi:two-component system response regulator NreC